jgi:hypothetical protein
VALPGGPLFTQGALQAIVRHAHGVPRDVNLLCTNVLQAGFWAQQQPITADLVQQVIAASTASRPFPLGRLGFAAAAGLVLAVGLLWVAPFSSGPQATRSHPPARVRSWIEVRRPTNVPLVVAPPLQQPDPAPQTRAESTPGRAIGQDPDTSTSRRRSRLRASARRHRPPPSPLASPHHRPPPQLRQPSFPYDLPHRHPTPPGVEPLNLATS